ncbi:MAG: glutamate-5-semialdehyde dehydrogenase [Lentisphaeria bacterium]|nr:glutamate-5-semialdehyde dehydrogenase [Lentisphaeria bacterium]MDP7741036.1 glutamate-5-semialdehyde dehydrogenase [Lentisphaeria bacterium]
MSTLIQTMAANARGAARELATRSAESRDAALTAIDAALAERQAEILEANSRDIAAAEKMVQAGEIAAPLLKRLQLDKKYESLSEMVRSVRSQSDPLGRTQSAMELAGGLELYRVSVPIGVIGVIFESRPDALVQIAALCLKSGNAVLLKGGREASNSNRILAEVIEAATVEAGMPSGWIGLLETREDVAAILDLHHDIDLLIPRGSNEFVQHIMENTNIPVMGHADGICHVYVDAAADIDRAVRIAVDSKTQYVAVCNAAETLLVHRGIAPKFLAAVAPAFGAGNVELRGDAATGEILGEQVVPATDDDWKTEYLDYIIAIRVVDDIGSAIDHINTFGSHHTDTIVTEDQDAATQFISAVDSASVVHNASTRFADGFRYGLGAEVGISTNRLHSRGPVGLEGLTSYKYVLLGNGHVVDDFEGDQPQPYTHRLLDNHWSP